MLTVARSRAAQQGLTNVRFEQADAQVHPFDRAAVDLVVSVFGTMFFDDPVAAFSNLRGALAPGGRLALLVWRELARNEWVSAVRDALAVEAAGFRDVQFQAVDEPADLGGDLDEAYAFIRDLGVTHGLLNDLDEPTADRALDNLKEALTRRATPEGVLLGASSWLVTASV